MQASAVLELATAVCGRILNEPLALLGETHRTLATLATMGDPQAFFSLFMDMPDVDEDEDGIRIIPVVGTLMRGMFFDDYADLRARIDSAMEDGSVRGIILNINSPGGDVSGLFDLAEHIALQEGKPIFALANDMAASAAYAIASAADKVFVSRTGLVGSIGVLAVHVETADMEKAEGIKFTEIASGRGKTDLSRHKPLNARGRAALEDTVEKAAATFFEFISERRGLSVDAVRGQEAAVFTGQDGIEAGLADLVGTLDSVKEVMQDSLSSAAGRGGSVGVRAVAQQEKHMAETPINPDAPVVAPATPVALGADVIPISQAREQSETARAEGRAEFVALTNEINQLCQLAGRPDLAAGWLAETDITSDAVRERLLALRADASGADLAVDPHVAGPTAPGAVAPVIINAASVYAKRRAAVEQRRTASARGE